MIEGWPSIVSDFFVIKMPLDRAHGTSLFLLYIRLTETIWWGQIEAMLLACRLRFILHHLQETIFVHIIGFGDPICLHSIVELGEVEDLLSCMRTRGLDKVASLQFCN